MNSKLVLSVLRRLVRDPAGPTSAGIQHCGAKTEKSCDFSVQPLLALSDGVTMHPAEAVERSARAWLCGMTNAWR